MVKHVCKVASIFGDCIWSICSIFMINFWSIVIEPTVGESPSGPKKIVKAGGLVVEDIKVGSGAEAKNGKHVSIIDYKLA